MAEERKRLLKELLPFQALEAPKWRKTEDVPVKEMVAKIVEYSKEWEGQKKDNYESDLIEQVRQDFLVEFLFTREHGGVKRLFSLRGNGYLCQQLSR